MTKEAWRVEGKYQPTFPQYDYNGLGQGWAGFEIQHPTRNECRALEPCLPSLRNDYTSKSRNLGLGGFEIW